MPQITTPLIVATLAVGGAAWLGLSALRRVRLRLSRRLGRGAILGSAVVALYVVAATTLPPTPLAESTLEVDGAPWAVPAAPIARSILLRATLPPIEHGRSAQVKMTLGVADAEDGAQLLEQEGIAEEHWVRGRAGKMRTRSLATHPDVRIDLPATAIGRPLTVRLLDQVGETAEPIRAQVVKALPSPGPLSLGFAAFALASLLADALEPDRSSSSYAVGALFGSTLVLPVMVAPDRPGMAVVAAWLIGGVGGTVVATGLRAVARRVIPARELPGGAVPAVPKPPGKRG